MTIHIRNGNATLLLQQYHLHVLNYWKREPFYGISPVQLVNKICLNQLDLLEISIIAMHLKYISSDLNDTRTKSIL